MDKNNKSESAPELKVKAGSIPNRIGIAADHGGFELKERLTIKLHEAGYEVVDFGNTQLQQEDDYPDYVIPLARAVALRKVDRGIAICGSGVGACVAMNKVTDVRACLINDTFSARQGVEDDDLNVICLGGRVVGTALAWELVKTFLDAQFSGAERHNRRLAKVREVAYLSGQFKKVRGLAPSHFRQVKENKRKPLDEI